MRGIFFSVITAVAVFGEGAWRASQAAPRWTLTVDHTIGASSSANSMLTDVRGLAVNGSGDVFVLDDKTADIRMFDARGAFVRRVTRKGRGPGELLAANGILPKPGGGFVVNDVDNARLTVWSARGTYERQILIDGDYRDYVWLSGWDAEGRIIESTGIAEGTGRNVRSVSRLRRIRITDGTADTLPEISCTPPGPRTTIFTGEHGAGPGMLIPFLAFQREAIDREGNFWCSPGNAYRLERHQVGGRGAPEILTRAVAAEPVPKAERDSVLAVVDSFRRRWRGGNTDPALIPTTKPVIEGLMVDDSGRLWVKRAGTIAAPTRYDIWQRGRLLATVESKLRLAREIPIVVVGDKLYGVALDDDDVQSVVVAKIVR